MKTYTVCGKEFPFVLGEAKVSKLAQLAIDLSREIDAASAGLLDFLKHARNAGEVLLHAYEITGHRSKWSKWRREHFQGSKETALIYMRIAKHWDNPRVIAARNRGVDSIHGLMDVIRNKRKKQDQPSGADHRTQEDIGADWMRDELRRWFNKTIREMSPKTVERYWGDYDKIFCQLVRPHLRAELRKIAEEGEPAPLGTESYGMSGNAEVPQRIEQSKWLAIRSDGRESPRDWEDGVNCIRTGERQH